MRLPFTIGFLLLLLTNAPCLWAQESGTQTAVAPPEVREVIAEGRAAIGTGGVIAARKAAEAQALRNAVERVSGVFVSARTLTHNYTLVRDQIVTHSEGFATLKEIVRESVGTQEVRVTVRALVSLRPLSERLKALKLTRAWRVLVRENQKEGADTSSVSLSKIEHTLSDAGFVVVSRPGDADLIVRVTPHFTTVQDIPLETAAGAMTMHAVRGEIGLRVTRVGTDEVVAALSSSQTASHIGLQNARSEAAEAVLEHLAPRLAEDLIVLPAQASLPVSLSVANLTSATLVGKFEDALQGIAGVQNVTRRSWNGTAIWELDVLTDALPLLARNLENAISLRPFHLTVQSETRAHIAALANGTRRAAKR